MCKLEASLPFILEMVCIVQIFNFMNVHQMQIQGLTYKLNDLLML